MDFSFCPETELEKWITKHYLEHNLLLPGELDIDVIAELFSVTIVYYNGACFSGNESQVIFLNKNMNMIDRRDVFFHELCHVLRHAGDQRKMPRPFLDLQEGQAEVFALYASLPLYMLREIHLPSNQEQATLKLSQMFKVRTDTALSRLLQIQRRICGNIIEEEYRKKMHRSYVAGSTFSNKQGRTERNYELALLYNYHENEMPSALVIKIAQTNLDWSRPVYISIPAEIESIEPDHLEGTTSTQISYDVLLSRTDKPGCLGINLPLLLQRIGTKVNNLIVRLDDVNYDIQQKFLHLSNF
ncbi:ImmA/IrrE family metallo-endopeptidase [Paenibacillus sepulcri]|uniref:ImmA/IrrE family metallo-endopeptidase n=1 Tax=Paenibacillus sepulcri TaxID=359917 RepID=A0ABS7BYY2_9BACL|nr:ImmA/IrrE family metallo-endopeptidase [Paenibacillus sepulcri]